MPERGMKTLCCERFGCPPDQYEGRAFRRCLYWHVRLLAPVLRRLSPGLVAKDIKFIQELGLTGDWRAARAEILTFQEENQAKGSIWRNGLRLRVSGRKATDLAQRLFAEERRKNAHPSPS